MASIQICDRCEGRVENSGKNGKMEFYQDEFTIRVELTKNAGPSGLTSGQNTPPDLCATCISQIIGGIPNLPPDSDAGFEPMPSATAFDTPPTNIFRDPH